MKNILEEDAIAKPKFASHCIPNKNAFLKKN